MRVKEILQEGRMDFILEPMKAEFYKKWEELKREYECDDDEKLFTQLIAHNTYLLRGNYGVDRGVISFHKTFDDPQNPVTTFKHWLKELNFGIRHLSVDKQRNVIRLGRESVLETLYPDRAMIDPKFTLQLETYVPSSLNSTFEEIKGGAPWVQAYKNGSYRILLKCTSKSAVPATEKTYQFSIFSKELVEHICQKKISNTLCLPTVTIP